MQVFTALQCENCAFPLDPTFRLDRFIGPVCRTSVAPILGLREGLCGFGVGCRGGIFIAVAQRQFRPQPPGESAVASAFEKSLGAGIVTLLIIHRRQPIGVFEAATGAVFQEFDQFFLVRRFIAERPALTTEQRCGDKLLHRFVFQQSCQLTLGQLRQLIHQLLERGVAYRRTVQVLRLIQFDRAGPIASGAQYPRFFPEAGDAELQRIAETVDAQLASLTKCFARFFQRLDPVVRLGADGKPGAPQGVRGPRAAQGALIRRQRQQPVEILNRQLMIACCERHRACHVKTNLRWQTGTLRLDLTRIRQTAQLFDQRLLFWLEPDLLGLFTLFDRFSRLRIGFVRVVGRGGDVLQPRDGFTQATQLKVEVALRQLRHRLPAIIEQAHREVRAAGQRRTQRQAEAQAEQMAGPVTGQHANLLDQYLRNAPNQWRAARSLAIGRREGG